MSIILRKSLISIILLVSASFSAEAQILGQQSLSRSSYVIDQNGTLWAWGNNFYGQLGVGDRSAHSTPAQVPLPPGVSKWVLVAGGQNHAIAVGDSDKLYTWGLNDRGQIGNGTAGGLYVLPVLIKNPITVRYWKWVSAGTDHCEALDQDGILYAWGNNSLGQLGVGNTKYLVSPEMVEFPTGVTSWGAVAAGPGYTIMVAQNGHLYGCGIDSLGTFQPYEGPLPAMSDSFRAYSPLPCIAASYRLESRIDQTYNYFQKYSLFVSPDGGSEESSAAVADGGWHSLFLTMEGKIAASGDNTYGQLGIIGDTSFHLGIVPFPPGVTQFVAIAAGLKHSLAIGNDGWLYAWGNDSLGELGIGLVPNQVAPTRVMRVCAPLAMTGSFTIPSNFFSGPYTISLKVTNTGSTAPLTNADAFLVLGGPLSYTSSGPDQSIPSPIVPNGSSAATWDGSVSEQFYDTIAPVYFAYIRADGSAPLLVYGSPTNFNTLLPWKICDQANVVDSLTGLPLKNAFLIFPGPSKGDVFLEPHGPPFDPDKMVSDEDGFFSLCFNGPVFDALDGSRVRSYQFDLSKENYRTQRYTLTEPQKEKVTFQLGPSDIQGTFVSPGPQFLGDSIVKVYYPDTLIGYALSRRMILRTLDSGISWEVVYEADTDLHDLKFIDPAEGWVVGDNGEILTTRDSGEVWTVGHVGTHNLYSIALIDYDTSWAVGDGGTVLKRSGDVWTAGPPLQDTSLTAIHFFDPLHGVIAAKGAFYLYDGVKWTRQKVKANLRAAYYATPDVIFLAGENGVLIEDSARVLFNYDSTYTTHGINSIYFVNESVGYVVGDSGSSFITYDGGMSWADLPEFPHNATSINFFGLAGHGVSDNVVLNYAGIPDTFKAIVRGRLTGGNPPIPIMGAEVDRYFTDRRDSNTVPNLIDKAYTNDQGNFVFTGIDPLFHYEYEINFTDSGIQKQKTFPDTLAHRREIMTLNYCDYTPVMADTTLADVNSAPADNLSLYVRASQSTAHILYSVNSDGRGRLVLQDILGRTLRVIFDGFSKAGQRETDVEIGELPSGVYFVSDGRSRTKFVKE